MRRRRDTADHRLKGRKHGRENNGICAGPDKRLYCAPRGASTVLVVDPKTDKLLASFVDPKTDKLSFIEGAGAEGNKYLGICAVPDRRLCCAPNNATPVLVVDPKKTS